MDPYVSEVRAFSFNFAPRGWAACNGQLLSISQNSTLYSLIGSYYGGNGTTTFALPNLQGRVPIGAGQGPGRTNRPLGGAGGAREVTLTLQQIGEHTHQLQASTESADEPLPGTAAVLARSSGGEIYTTSTGGSALFANESLVAAGGGAAHNNLQPYLTIQYCIALVGVYPPRP